MSAVKILVYRLGSLGDTLLALPVFQAIRRHFNESRIVVLTNNSVNSKAAPLESVLEHSGLIDDVIKYPVGLRGVAALAVLRRRIANERIDIVINLAEARGLNKSFRDYIFFRASGIRRVIGTPWRKRDLAVAYNGESGLFEWEASRLARRLACLGPIDLNDPASWNLHFTDLEKTLAKRLKTEAGIPHDFLALSVGTKVEIKDWSELNWQMMCRSLAQRFPALAVVAIGSGEERSRTERCLATWTGPKLNLCGRASVRVVGAVLQGARVFVGHDSGPMHLAATVDVPCVAIFSARNLPGHWFPRGNRNKIFYRKTPCFGCGLDTGCPFDNMCIRGIAVEDVLSEVVAHLPPSIASEALN